MATVLAELAEQITGSVLVDVATAMHDIFATQRPDYILNVIGYTTLANELKEWLARASYRLQTIP